MTSLVLLLVACAPSAALDGAGDPGAVDQEAVDEVGAPAPALTEQGALDAVAAGTANGLPDTVDLWNRYLGLMAQGDGGCPGPGDQLIDTQVSSAGCTADSGVRYAGVSLIQTEADMGGGEDAYARLLGGDFTITDLDGETLDFGGQVGWGEFTSHGGARVILAEAEGTFRYPGASPWLDGGVSAVLHVEVQEAADHEPRLSLDGGLGAGGVDLWFDALGWDPSACAGPMGSVRMRDPSGAWWTFTYADTCDSCGTLSYPGRPDVGTCLDLRTVYAAAVPMLERAP